MSSTSVGVVIKQQAWFRPHVDVEGLEPFPIEKIDLVTLLPTNVFHARALIGRGPVDRELTPELLLWFEHGELEYPVFQSPSIGPSNAGLNLSGRPRRLVALENEPLSLIEVSVVIPVSPSFRSELEAAQGEQLQQGPSAAVRSWLSEARMWLDQAIGLYAVYQYPIIWELLSVYPTLFFVDVETQTFTRSTRIELDNFIPFRLKVVSRVQKGHLVDSGLADFSRLKGRELHFPLLLLQRALWQQNIQLRFLEAFLMLDYMASQTAVEDPQRAEREDFYGAIEQFVVSTNPRYEERVKALKHIVLQAPLRERLQLYLGHLGIALESDALRQMLKVRNDLAHARPVDNDVLIPLELQLRSLAREVLRRELANRGITFGGVVDSPQA